MNAKMLLLLSVLVAFIDFLSADECPALLLRYSLDHSYCKNSSESCNIMQSYVHDAEIEIILKEHNKYRSKIATGKEPSLPPATNMLQMVWDDELAAVAQKYAEQCKFDHDCGNCRRVQNFDVGQNIAMLEYTFIFPTKPGWEKAVKVWYDELVHFNKNLINSFQPSMNGPIYGHFTQLIWADSWRVGCGFVTYNEGNSFFQLYICNYGPAGNMFSGKIYNKGHACDECPVNSCCEKTCGSAAEYPGLCKITDNRAPKYKKKERYLFYCDFQEQPDCDFYVSGENKFEIATTLSGSYLSIVLNGGESSEIKFKKHIIPTSAPFCLMVKYRKGPNVDGQEEANKAEVRILVTKDGYLAIQHLPNSNPALRHQFSGYDTLLQWYMESEVSISFSVPPGAPAQFFEIKEVAAKAGPC